MVIGIGGITAKLTGQVFDVDFIPVSSNSYSEVYGLAPPLFLNDEEGAFWMSVDTAAVLNANAAVLAVDSHADHQAVVIPFATDHSTGGIRTKVDASGGGFWNYSEIALPDPNDPHFASWIWPGSDFSPPLVFAAAAVWTRFRAADPGPPGMIAEPTTSALLLLCLTSAGLVTRIRHRASQSSIEA